MHALHTRNRIFLAALSASYSPFWRIVKKDHALEGFSRRGLHGECLSIGEDHPLGVPMKKLILAGAVIAFVITATAAKTGSNGANALAKRAAHVEAVLDAAK